MAKLTVHVMDRLGLLWVWMGTQFNSGFLTPVLGHLFAQCCDARQEQAAAATGTWSSLGGYPRCHGPILSGFNCGFIRPPKGFYIPSHLVPASHPPCLLPQAPLGHRKLGFCSPSSWRWRQTLRPGCTFLCSCPWWLMHAVVMSLRHWVLAPIWALLLSSTPSTGEGGSQGPPLMLFLSPILEEGEERECSST